MFLNKN